jgi:hypothetical protein
MRGLVVLSVVLSSVWHAVAQSASAAAYASSESPIAKAGVLANIGPNGSKSQGAKGMSRACSATCYSSRFISFSGRCDRLVSPKQPLEITQTDCITSDLSGLQLPILTICMSLTKILLSWYIDEQCLVNRYTWTRDSSLVFKMLIDQYTTGMGSSRCSELMALMLIHS